MSVGDAMQWKQRPEGGGRWPIRLIGWIGRHCPRALTGLLLYPITLYFLLVRGAERRASRDYLARVLGRPATLWEVARHIHTFAATILDRVYLLGGRDQGYRIDSEGTDCLLQALSAGRGALLFGAHVGSFDALRAFGRERPDIAIRVLLDVSHNRTISEFMAELDPQLAAGIIDVGQDGTAIVLAVAQALEQGALVAMLVDRVGPGESGIQAPLLGSPARFAAVPWMLASSLKVPVVLGFGLCTGYCRYHMVFEPFADCIQIPRRERSHLLPQLIHRYAARLDDQLRHHPYNWFNFYDFWQAPATAESTVAGSDAAGGQPAPR